MQKQSHLLSFVFGALAILLIMGNQADANFPIVNNDRTTLITLGFLGMALCAQGIGRVAQDKRWLHPISLLGMLIGALTLFLWIGRLVNFNLPFTGSDSQAILALGLLMGGKFLLARAYALFRRFPQSGRDPLP